MGQSIDDWGDRRFAFLVALVKEAQYRTRGVGVDLAEVGERSGFTPQEIEEYEGYWVDTGRLEGITLQHVAVTALAVDDVDEAEETRTWESVRDAYVSRGYPNHKAWWVQIDQGERRGAQRLRAKGLIEPFAGNWRLTDRGLREIVAEQPGSGGINLHVTGDIVQGSKNTTTITGSNMNVAVGDGSTASGGAVSTDELRRVIKEAQHALVDDDDAVRSLGPGVVEALQLFLRSAKAIEVNQQTLATIQLQMKETLDEVWAKQVGKEIKPSLLPASLGLMKVLAESPITSELVKHLLGS